MIALGKRRLDGGDLAGDAGSMTVTAVLTVLAVEFGIR